MRISEVSQRLGVAPSTLRYYESIGLVAAQRGVNGYRDYDDEVLEQLVIIGAAASWGCPCPRSATC